ncbi:MAG: LacI family DNA-binding transcriptional regulator [Micrococcales bacterium]|nr:LacI family DNA-binding transcriptional regulator [Micrococcales bacterium]
MDGDRRVTLLEVAQRAEVSLKTAHRALTGEGPVKDSTRERVRQAARELGYRFNASASMLKRGVSMRVIALVVSDLQNPFYSRIASGMEEVLREHGIGLVLANSDEDPVLERQLIDGFTAQRVDAIVVVSTAIEHGGLAMVQTTTPLVFVDRAPVGLDADAVLLDDAAGIATAVEHLYAHGHRRIGFVGDYPRLQTARDRVEAFIATAERLGAETPRDYIRTGGHDAATARQLTRTLLEAATPPTALVAANNRVAVGTLEAAFTTSARIALVGFDDFELAEALGVTVVRHDAAQLGREAARLALEEHVPTREPKRILVPTTLVPRGSGEVRPGELRRIRVEW